MSNKCVICDQLANYDKEIVCDFCRDVTHTTCSGLSRNEITCLKVKDRKISYYCLRCENLKKQISQLQDLSSKVESLENELKEIKTFLRDNQLPAGSHSTVTSVNNTEDFIAELHDRQKRAQNLIIFNIPESSKQSINERRIDDETKVNEILQVFENLDVELSNLKVFRLGSRSPERNRPIKICLSDAADVLKVLKNKNRLADRRIRIYSDMTPMQRESLKKLQNELRQLKDNGDDTKVIRYINNVPKIVPLRKSKN